MLLLAFIAYVGVVTAAICEINGPGTAQPRVCPSVNCDLSGPAISTAGSPPLRNIDCIWDNGATVPGGGSNGRWGYTAEKAFIWSGRLGYCNIDSIPKCVVTAEWTGAALLPPNPLRGP